MRKAINDTAKRLMVACAALPVACATKTAAQTGQILQNPFCCAALARADKPCVRARKSRGFRLSELGVFLLGQPASEKMNSIAATMYAAVTSPEDMVILQLFVKVNVF